jgi:DNA-3-methyladenine glycosylase II
VALQEEVRPASPFRLGRGSEDRTLRVHGGIATRLLHVGSHPVVVRAWQPGPDRVLIRAEPIDPDAVMRPVGDRDPTPAGRDQLVVAIERMRFALGVDDDMSGFHLRFRRDPLVGPLLRRMPRFRLQRRPWPWEALASAVVKQLIESDRAARIERRIVGRWGPRLGEGRAALRDVPDAATIARRAPAEIESMDLAGTRAIALRRVAW